MKSYIGVILSLSDTIGLGFHVPVCPVSDEV